MNSIKSVLKYLGAFVVGGLIGLLIAFLIIGIFTEMSMREFADKMMSTDFNDSLLAALVGIVSLAVSVPIITIIHEGGHLVCGLLSGYKFVSFRIFNYAFLRENGRIRMKHFAVAGTGGQCLLTPPDLPEAEIPVVWYNIGGVLANLLSILLVLPVFWTDANAFIKEFAIIFILVSLIMIVLNGIPMQISGINNDGMNAIRLNKNPDSLHGIVIQLRANALIQEGVRPKDMPDEYFEIPPSLNYRNALQVAIPIMAASRLLDEGRIDEAHSAILELYNHRAEIMPLYNKEICCELIYTSLLTGDIEKAEELYDADIQKYIKMYRKVMSSKERVMCAVALYLENNREKAQSIYDSLLKRQDQYMLQGEVKSDLALMKQMMDCIR